MTPELRASLTAYYADAWLRAGTRKDSVAWKQTQRDLVDLRTSADSVRPSGAPERP